MQDFGNLKFNSGERGGHRLALDKPVLLGQKIILWAVAANILAVAFVVVVLPSLGLALEAQVMVAVVAWGVRIVTMFVGAAGVVVVGGGLQWGLVPRLLLAMLALIPFLGLIVLLIVNAQASSHLKSAGYKVGLMGARKPA